MDYSDSAIPGEVSIEKICLKCGSLCCKLGGIVATKNEVDAVIAQGFPNYFTRLSSEVYGTEWGRDGTCPYLEEGRCSIYSLRPMGCRMFPVVQTPSNDTILVECPLASYLSKDELRERKDLLTQRPEQFLKASEQHRHEHIRALLMRVSKYNHRKLS